MFKIIIMHNDKSEYIETSFPEFEKAKDHVEGNIDDFVYDEGDEVRIINEETNEIIYYDRVIYP